MKSRLLIIFQHIFGFILGIAFLAGAFTLGFYLYVSKMTFSPSKPIFTEEKEQPNQVAQVNNNNNAQETGKTTEVKEKSENSESQTTPEASETEETDQANEEKLLPANAYRAKVTWPQGLSLREEPSLNATNIGGITYNAEIIILEETEDKQWQKVLLPWSDQEGWVRGGNVERIYE